MTIVGKWKLTTLLVTCLVGCDHASGGSVRDRQQAAVVEASQSIYFRCRTTSWQPDAVSRLTETTPGVFRLSYSVSDSSIIRDGDSCSLTITNAADGWGTSQRYLGPTGGAVDVPTTGTLGTVSDGDYFRVAYPSSGEYELTVDAGASTFSLAAGVSNPEDPGEQEPLPLFLRCGATGWNPGPSTRLIPVEPGGSKYQLTYEVTQDYMVRDADHCTFTRTNDEDSWGSYQEYNGTQPSDSYTVPASGTLDINSSDWFRVQYPALGLYQVRVDEELGTFSISQAPPVTPIEPPPIYFRSAATDWNPSSASQLDPGGAIYTLTYEVTEEYMVRDGAYFSFVETNSAGGWGTDQNWFQVTGTGDTAVPTTGEMIPSQEAHYFKVRYPSLGEYTVRLNRETGDFSVETARTLPTPPSRSPPSPPVNLRANSIRGFLDWMEGSHPGDLAVVRDAIASATGDEAIAAALVEEFEGVRATSLTRAMMVLEVLGALQTNSGARLFLMVLREEIPPGGQSWLLGFQVKAAVGLAHFPRRFAREATLAVISDHPQKVVRDAAARALEYNLGSSTEARAALRGEDLRAFDAPTIRQRLGVDYNEQLETFLDSYPDAVVELGPADPNVTEYPHH